MKPILLSAVLALSLAGCGNKGPLVLPSQPPADEAAMPVEPPPAEPLDATSPLGNTSPTDAALDDTAGNTAGGDDTDVDVPPPPAR